MIGIGLQLAAIVILLYIILNRLEQIIEILKLIGRKL